METVVGVVFILGIVGGVIYLSIKKRSARKGGSGRTDNFNKK